MVVVWIEADKQYNNNSVVGKLSNLLETNVSLDRTLICSVLISYLCAAIFCGFCRKLP